MTKAQDKPDTNTRRAVTELRARIFDGTLPAGSDHLESELAAQLGMSRTPVREALMLLEAQGLLQMRPRRGVRITALTPQDMAEIYDVLTELESLAAERAATRGLDAAGLRALARAVADMEAALACSDLDRWSEADDRFHAELMGLGGNNRAEAIAAVMSDQVRRARRLTLHMRPLPERSNDDHRRVLQAIQDGDSARARRLHRAHRKATKALLVDLLERHALRFV